MHAIVGAYHILFPILYIILRSTKSIKNDRFPDYRSLTFYFKKRKLKKPHKVIIVRLLDHNSKLNILAFQVILEHNAVKHRTCYLECVEKYWGHWRHISYETFPLFVTDQFSVASTLLKKVFAVVQPAILHSPGWGMKSRSYFLKHIGCLVDRALDFRKTINFY